MNLGDNNAGLIESHEAEPDPFSHSQLNKAKKNNITRQNTNTLFSFFVCFSLSLSLCCVVSLPKSNYQPIHSGGGGCFDPQSLGRVPYSLLFIPDTTPFCSSILWFSPTPVMAESSTSSSSIMSADSGDINSRSKFWKGAFAVAGIMVTLVTYGVLQEKIMRIPYGTEKEYFKYSLFLVFCNRITTSAVSAASLLASKKAIDPVAPIYKYCLVSVSNILTTTCQYEALKYVSFPVQTLAKCAKMIPVMVWGTIIMQKKYQGPDYLLAFLVTLGCSVFILYPAGTDISPYSRGRENTAWGVVLMVGYLGFDGFTSTFQDKLFKGYDMEIHNQIFYTTLCSCILSLTGLIFQGHLIPAVEFVYLHHDCLFDIALLSTVATASQFFISYTIRNFGALTFATIMTTRQLVSIMLSCVWFSHPLSWEQWIGAVIVFSSLYGKSFLKKPPPKTNPSIPLAQNGDSNFLKV